MKMEDFDPSFSLSDLFCDESESSFSDHCEYVQEDDNFDKYMISESDDEYINKLIQNEVPYRHLSITNDDNSSNQNDPSWQKNARFEAIQWILDTRAFFGFHFRTAYLSLLYFDLFLSKRSIQDGKIWAFRLLSVACLSIAAKMEERKVPGLSAYYVDEYNFQGNVVQKMELLVLPTLDWKMNLNTPFTYLHYFIFKFFGESKPKDIYSKAIELISALLKEVNLVDHPPSIIASAVVLAAYDSNLTNKILELKISIISSWGPTEKESILFLYNLIQEKEILKSNTPNSVLCPKMGNNNTKCNGDLEKSTITTSVIGTKRKLPLDDYDLHFPPPKIPRS